MASTLLLLQQQGANRNSKGADTAARGAASKIAGTAARGQPQQHGRNTKDIRQDGSGQEPGLHPSSLLRQLTVAAVANVATVACSPCAHPRGGKGTGKAPAKGTRESLALAREEAGLESRAFQRMPSDRQTYRPVQVWGHKCGESVA